jgi:hypothetical protein
MTTTKQEVTSLISGNPVWKTIQDITETGPVIRPLGEQIVLIQGWPGSGKSRILHSIPRCLILDTERGSGEFEIIHDTSARVRIQTKRDLDRVLTALLADAGKKDRTFTTVAVDTIDSLGGNPNSIIGTQILNDNGVDTMAEVGSNGKGYGDMATLTNRFLQQIVEAGYGLWMTCHLRKQQIHEWEGLKQTTRLAITRDLTNGLESWVKKMSGYCWTAEHLVEMKAKTVKRTINGAEKEIQTGETIPVDVYRLLDRTEPGRQELTKSRQMRLTRGGLNFDVDNAYELLDKLYTEQMSALTGTAKP